MLERVGWKAVLHRTGRRSRESGRADRQQAAGGDGDGSTEAECASSRKGGERCSCLRVKTWTRCRLGTSRAAGSRRGVREVIVRDSTEDRVCGGVDLRCCFRVEEEPSKGCGGHVSTVLHHRYGRLSGGPPWSKQKGHPKGAVKKGPFGGASPHGSLI